MCTVSITKTLAGQKDKSDVQKVLLQTFSRDKKDKSDVHKYLLQTLAGQKDKSVCALQTLAGQKDKSDVLQTLAGQKDKSDVHKSDVLLQTLAGQKDKSDVQKVLLQTLAGQKINLMYKSITTDLSRTKDKSDVQKVLLQTLAGQKINLMYNLSRTKKINLMYSNYRPYRQKDKSDVQFIEFGKYSCSHLLTACSKESLVTWNLSSCTVLWNIDFNSVSLISDPETDVMAVISNTSDVYFFRPSSPDILYHQNTISSSKVASAVFIPQHQGRQSLTALEKGRQLPTKSKLYFINSDHQLLCLSEVDTAVTAPKTMFTIQQNLPQTTLSLLLSKENTKQPAVDSRSTSKDIKSWKAFLDTPPQVQPAVTSLCKQFVQSMLVKSGTNSGNIEDDEELSDEECVMEVDDDVDSDEDVISQGKSQNMKNKNTKPKDSIKQTVIHTDTRAKDDYVSYMDWYIKR
ncbi:unnamed protein product [Mytilus edulis]|uniref:WD repeat-containing protein 75 second beta-propeller domain-containing protein n=1 Tax=Mytilus edulis TaxID=6550 RepID=A0A8S3VGT6_MYTED|nr:unnamed protein product [Mytilus edulis]